MSTELRLEMFQFELDSTVNRYRPLLLLFLVFCTPKAVAQPQGVEARHRKFLLSDRELNTTPPDVLSRKEAVEDFEAFEVLLKDAYGGYDYFREQGTDWDGLFAKTQNLLRRQQDWPLTGYFGVLTDFLREAKIVDGHLSLTARTPTIYLRSTPGLKHWTARFADVYVKKSGEKFLLISRSSPTAASEELLSVEGQPPDHFLFRTYIPGVEGQSFLVGSFGEKPSDLLRGKVAGVEDDRIFALHDQRMNEYRHPPSSVAEKVVEGVPVVTISTLGMDHESELVKFSDTAIKLRSERAVILDLRGCAGGNDGYGIRWLQRLTSETLHTKIKKISRTSLLACVGEANRWKRSLLDLPDETGRKHAEGYLEEALKRLDDTERAGKVESQKTETFEFPGLASGKFAGTLIILSDRSNGSAGEGLLKVARSLPGAVIMGQNSFGVSSFGPVSPFRLPNSGIEVQLGEAVNYFDGKIYEAQGLPPDYWIDEIDALPEALSYAKAMGSR